MDNHKPLLTFRPPDTYEARIQSTPFPFTPKPIRYPSFEEQATRLAPKFRELEAATVSVHGSAEDQDIHSILVIELVGREHDFMRIVENLGFEGIGEFDIPEIDPDEFFHYEATPDGLLGGQLYLVMTNREALRQLLRLWNLHAQDASMAFAPGQRRWKDLFRHIRDMRLWGTRERFIETGMRDYWINLVTDGSNAPFTYRMEVEFWFSPLAEVRGRQFAGYQANVIAENGRIIGHACVIPEIQYHGILIELPAEAVQRFIAHPELSRLNDESVMYFHPVGQNVAASGRGAPGDQITFSNKPLPSGIPIVALLDGLPMQNHEALRNRLLIDDPDGWASTYAVAQRSHGTSMASLIIHNELDANQDAILSPVYVRPILQARVQLGQDEECIPDSTLFVDLLHRAVKRIFEGEAGVAPTAPSVKIINLCVCDPYRPFLHRLSPLAKLIDWLSHKYNVLFVISAGNHPQQLLVEPVGRDLSVMSREELQNIVLRAVMKDRRHRTILSPADSINALTIGAAYTDASTTPPRDLQALQVYECGSLPSPVSAIGHGYRRAIKPDVLMPGGRALYRHFYGTDRLTLSKTIQPPGNRVAKPSLDAGDLMSTAWTRGTSNAAAIATHTLVRLDETLADLGTDANSLRLLQSENRPALLKALLVHGASWGEAASCIQNVITGHPYQKQQRSAQMLGFGLVDVERLHDCTDQRATLISSNSLAKDMMHVYQFPLPLALLNIPGIRVLTITLAWITPINCANKKYRQARLKFEIPKSSQIQIGSRLLYPNVVGNGTVQHEIFTTEKLWQFEPNSFLEIAVRCTEDAHGLASPISYGLVATLEVAPSLGIEIYDSIREVISPRIRVATT